MNERSWRILLVILTIAFGARLIHLDAPFYGLSWRQADSAAIARNFYENGYDLFYPQVDWGGAGSGYVECEFPIYSFVAALAYPLLGGVSEASGRFISLLCALVTLVFLVRLVAETVDERTALWTGFFYAVLPLNVFYGRTFMPDSAMVAAGVTGVYFFRKWILTGRPLHFMLSAGAVCLAALLKPPILHLGIPLLYLAGKRYGKRTLFAGRLWLWALLVLAPVVAWYWHAHRIYLDGGVTFGVWGYGTDKWGNWDLVVTWRYWNRVLLQWIAERHLTWPGFVVLLVGLSLRRQTRSERLYDVWLLGSLLFLVVVAGGNFAHEYYPLPVLIPLLPFMGKVFARHFRREHLRSLRGVALAVLLVGIVFSSGHRYSAYMKRETPAASQTGALAELVQELTAPGKLVIVLDHGDPTLMYLAHRKGWHMGSADFTPEIVEARWREGARYVFGLRRDLSVSVQRPLEDIMAGSRLLSARDAPGFVIELPPSPS